MLDVFWVVATIGSVAFAVGTLLWIGLKLAEIQTKIWEEQEKDVR